MKTTNKPIFILITTFISCSLLILNTVNLSAQKDYTPILDKFMEAQVEVNNFNGSILIAKSGKIIYQKTFGTLDYESKHPLNSNSLFQIGIITEEFTAAAILMLKEQGKLKLTDPITKYIPEFPYNNVTIEHLLTHTSGLPQDYYDVMANKWGTEKLATNKDMLKLLIGAKVSLKWEPGTKCHSHHPFTDFPILASIIEKISGQKYEEFMQQKIFSPLKLQHTKVIAELQLNKDLIPNHTVSVYFDESKQMFFPADSFKLFPPELTYACDGILGGKGISSTANDLFIWDRAIKNNKLISEASQKAMCTPYALKDTATKIYYGYGTLVGKNDLGNYVQQMDAGNNEILGYNTKLIRYIDEDLTIIVLANKSTSSSGLGGVLAEILFDREVVTPYTHHAVSIDTSLIDNYVGKYRTPEIIELVKKEGLLWIRWGEEPDLKLLAESPTKFFSTSKEYDVQIEFETDKSGIVAKIFLISRGLKKEMKKI